MTIKKEKDYSNNERYTTFYEGKEINKRKIVFDEVTQEHRVYNAVYLPEEPKKRTLPANKYFGKSFLRNKQHLIRLWTGKIEKGSKQVKLSGYDLGVLALVESFITWENNVLYDTQSKSYITAKDLSDITDYDEETISKSLKRLAALGIIFFIKGKRNERYIMLNPYIAYMGDKMELWVYEIISNEDLPFQPVAKVQFDIIPQDGAK